MSADNKHIVRSFYEDVVNNINMEKLESLCASDVIFQTSLGHTHGGLEGILEHIDFLHNALGNLFCDVKELIGDDAKVCARITISGTHRGQLLHFDPTDQIIEWPAIAIFTISDNRISSIWTLGDVHGLIKQMADAAPMPNLDDLPKL